MSAHKTLINYNNGLLRSVTNVELVLQNSNIFSIFNMPFSSLQVLGLPDVSLIDYHPNDLTISYLEYYKIAKDIEDKIVDTNDSYTKQLKAKFIIWIEALQCMPLDIQRMIADMIKIRIYTIKAFIKFLDFFAAESKKNNNPMHKMMEYDVAPGFLHYIQFASFINNMAEFNQLYTNVIKSMGRYNDVFIITYKYLGALGLEIETNININISKIYSILGSILNDKNMDLEKMTSNLIRILNIIRYIINTTRRTTPVLAKEELLEKLYAYLYKIENDVVDEQLII